MGALVRTDFVFDEDGTGRGLRSEETGMLAVCLAAVIDVGRCGVVAAIGGPFAALMDVLKVVLDLSQPAPQVRVFRFQLCDPLLEGAHDQQDGGLGLGRNGVPERCGDRRWWDHTHYYEGAVQRVRPANGSGCLRIPISGSRTA